MVQSYVRYLLGLTDSTIVEQAAGPVYHEAEYVHTRFRTSFVL